MLEWHEIVKKLDLEVIITFWASYTAGSTVITKKMSDKLYFYIGPRQEILLRSCTIAKYIRRIFTAWSTEDSNKNIINESDDIEHDNELQTL